jgi:hypothetical protein
MSRFRRRLNREVLLRSIEMSDWELLERFRDGRHNFPRFVRQSSGGGPRRVRVTLAYVRAHRGTFTYDDQGAPWSTVARNLDIAVTKGVEYRGTASFKGGTVTIGRHVPMWAGMDMVFRLDGPRVHVERLNLETDGASEGHAGRSSRFPYKIWRSAAVQLPGCRIFFRRELGSLG